MCIALAGDVVVVEVIEPDDKEQDDPADQTRDSEDDEEIPKREGGAEAVLEVLTSLCENMTGCHHQPSGSLCSFLRLLLPQWVSHASGA